LKADKRLRPFLDSVSEEGVVIDAKKDNIKLVKGQGWLSADLTKATDGFYHNAIQAVIRGLERAGLGESWALAAAQSLGVGPTRHYVRYRLDAFPADRLEEIAGRYAVYEITGKKYVNVPMLRGCLMGTPLSFTVLSIINGWCSKPLGVMTRIVGDDVVAACYPPAITRYGSRVSDVGSGLHEMKTFFGTRGFTFCEVFGLGYPCQVLQSSSSQAIPERRLWGYGQGRFCKTRRDSVVGIETCCPCPVQRCTSQGSAFGASTRAAGSSGWTWPSFERDAFYPQARSGIFVHVA
jgi:hypothetical protein